MTSGVPWQVEGIRPQARDAAREAARRSGMSVGEWLDSVIADRARPAESEPDRRPQTDDDGADLNERALARRRAYASYDDLRVRAPAAEIAEVKGRLDEV